VTRFRWVLAVFALYTLAGFAQQSPPAAPNGLAPEPSVAQGRDLTLDVVVTDKAGNPVRGLQRQDFALLDNKQPQALTSFRAVDLDAHTPAPYIEMIVVVDAINADSLNTGLAREGVRKFLQSNGGRLAVPVSVIFATDQPLQARPKASTDGNAQAALLDQYVTGPRIVNRSLGKIGSAERFQMSIKLLTTLTAIEESTPGRKLVLWIGPGWPLLSNGANNMTSQDQRHFFNSIVAMSNQLRLNHIAVYNIETRGDPATDTTQFFEYKEFLKGVKSAEQAYPGALSLQVLAVQTGGEVFTKSNDLPNEIAAEIAKGAADASPFYVLSAEAAKAERANEYHSFEVKVNKPGVIVRTRTGYYAQP
jgi:VWFA-related protein